MNDEPRMPLLYTQTRDRTADKARESFAHLRETNHGLGLIAEQHVKIGWNACWNTISSEIKFAINKLMEKDVEIAMLKRRVAELELERAKLKERQRG